MDNFYDTAIRMQKSSEILHNNGEFHNACYLAGYVVECYAKIIVENYSQNTPISFKHNLNRLDTELSSILSGNSSLSQYILYCSIDFSMILSKWNPFNLRYADISNTLNSQDSGRFQSEIQLAMQKLAKLKIDGII